MWGTGCICLVLKSHVSTSSAERWVGWAGVGSCRCSVNTLSSLSSSNELLMVCGSVATLRTPCEVFHDFITGAYTWEECLRCFHHSLMMDCWAEWLWQGCPYRCTSPGPAGADRQGGSVTPLLNHNLCGFKSSDRYKLLAFVTDLCWRLCIYNLICMYDGLLERTNRRDSDACTWFVSYYGQADTGPMINQGGPWGTGL